MSLVPHIRVVTTIRRKCDTEAGVAHRPDGGFGYWPLGPYGAPHRIRDGSLARVDAMKTATLAGDMLNAAVVMVSAMARGIAPGALVSSRRCSAVNA